MENWHGFIQRAIIPLLEEIEPSKEEQKLEISALEEVDKLLADLENGNV